MIQTAVIIDADTWHDLPRFLAVKILDRLGHPHCDMALADKPNATGGPVERKFAELVAAAFADAVRIIKARGL